MIQVSQFKNVIQVLDHFKDEATCKAYLEQRRWKNGKITCPHCNHDKVYKTTRGYKCAHSDCRKKFSVISGTMFENTKIKLRIWFAAMYLITAHKKGISSCQLARDLGITQKTAWFLNHRIREMMTVQAPERLKNIVEVDETYIGGKRQNMHEQKRKKLQKMYGPGFKEKTPVVGLLERGGNVIAHKIDKADGITLQPIVRSLVEKGSTLLTDGHGAYAGLKSQYNHVKIEHEKGIYGFGDYNTNSIEGFWGLFKRGIIGIYHHVSPKHLDRYCNEFTYRYNSRKVKDCERFDLTVANMHGRLKYENLIAA